MSQDILLASSRKLQKGISPNMILDKSETVSLILCGKLS